MKYAFIESQQDTFAVTRMCDMMDVSQSAYYDWLKRPESARCLEDRRLGEKVKKFHEKSRETYGAVVSAMTWWKTANQLAVRVWAA